MLVLKRAGRGFQAVFGTADLLIHTQQGMPACKPGRLYNPIL
ncbi:hypothetical protein B4099_0240 [Heyndrickxia coagulans]|uniref:Uncharacterized protein n=1 Tax=Heyndrickxia coagulans TaxID=1398 RepID=A0A150KFE5_HEYCO|nr:hypothetical protein B4099_0240 [Heyndrickxia coagulans]